MLWALDADDTRLKRHFSSSMLQELLERTTEKLVSTSCLTLGKNYRIQVKPREINLFHIGDEHRDRIVPSGVNYTAGERSWTRDQIMTELRLHPERFSPNVLMRPLYQETILPNICYVGGGGEIAYWLELKSTFEGFGVQFPILFLRTSALFLSEKASMKMDQAQLSISDLFLEKDRLKGGTASDRVGFETSLDSEWQTILSVFEQIERRVDEEGFVAATRGKAKRTENDIAALEKKLVRFAKKEKSVLMDRIDAVFNEVLPNGRLQERTENFVSLYLSLGEDWAKFLLNNLDPLDGKFTVISHAIARD